MAHYLQTLNMRLILSTKRFKLKSFRIMVWVIVVFRFSLLSLLLEGNVYHLINLFPHFIDERCRKTFYHAYIHNKLEYAILLFGGAAAHQLRPLKSLQKRKLKLVVNISSTNVFKAACVLPLQSLADFQRSLLIIKSINDKVPQYIKALFTLCPNDNNRFRLPLPRLDIYKSQSISFSAVMSWISLPINLRSSMRSILLNNFKIQLGNYLLSKV